MFKITLSSKSVGDSPKKFCQLKLTEEAVGWQRLCQLASGRLEYRLGIGKFKKVDARSFRLVIRTIVQEAKKQQITHLALALQPADFPKLSDYGTVWFYSTLAENLLLAGYEYTKYKSKKEKKDRELQAVLLSGVEGKEAKDGFARGQIVAECVNRSRDLANTPGRDMLPADLALAAKEMFKGSKVVVRVLGEKELKKLGMGALLAVGQGTRNETKFIIAEYWGVGKPNGKKTGKDKQPLVLVGKGITYDTGGLNVKPSGFMHDMHLDMSGGASVLAAVLAVARLGLKKNVVALVPAAENAISDEAMRAGDIVTSLSGQTIEILHTDAEGRMILADGLTYAARYEPRVIVDVATLTGAALVALGQQASAVMTKDLKLESKLRELGEWSGDLVWPLPLWDEYKQSLKSARADVANIATNFSRFGGAIEGGSFLSFFAPKGVPWAHIDIAPRMDSIAGDKLAKGATGEPVRLLVALAEQC